LALLPSPLLGPAVWSPVAADLADKGWPVVLPPRPPAPPRSPDDVLRHLLAALPADRDLVLVPHSNAGLYVPALTMRRRVEGYVFVDARLPPAAGEVPLAPPDLVDALTEKTDRDDHRDSGGLLPPWTRWWDEADVAALFPDTHTRERVEAEQWRIPMTYFRSTVPVPTGWDRKPGAYLAFGETYASERERAANRNWPVSTVPGDHLHQLVDPAGVASALNRLLAAIGLRPGSLWQPADG
jgi:hypothetical protein